MSVQMELAAIVTAALKNPPEGIEFIPLNAVTIDTARMNQKRHAFIKFHCPDQWVMNMRGNPKIADLYVVMKLPRDWVDKTRAEWNDSQKAEQVPSPTPIDTDGSASQGASSEAP